MLKLIPSQDQADRAYLWFSDGQSEHTFKIRRVSESEESTGCLSCLCAWLRSFFWFRTTALFEDETRETIWINKRSFQKRIGCSIKTVLQQLISPATSGISLSPSEAVLGESREESVLSSEELREERSSFERANERLRQLGLPELTQEQLEQFSEKEQRIIVTSLSQLPVENLGVEEEMFRAGDDPDSRKVSIFEKSLYIHFNRKKRGDEPIGNGSYSEVDDALLFEELNGVLSIRKVVVVVSKKEKESDFLDILEIVHRLKGVPGIAVVHQAVEYDGKHCDKDGNPIRKIAVFMDRYSEDLFNRLAFSKKKLSIEKRRKGILQLVEGIVFLHDEGVIHRDLKPDNVLLDPDDNFFWTDFGLSIFEGTEGKSGAPGYVAPEVGVLGSVGEKQEIFSLGLVCAQLCMKNFQPPTGDFNEDVLGRQPFVCSNTYAGLCLRRLRKEKIDKGIIALIDRMLAEDPEKRLTAREALAEFQRIFGGEAQ